MNFKSKEAVLQNLKDAGCSADEIRDFLFYIDNNQKEKQIKLLESCRNQLLYRVHSDEKKIYCLDYLIYQISKQG